MICLKKKKKFKGSKKKIIDPIRSLCWAIIAYMVRKLL